MDGKPEPIVAASGEKERKKKEVSSAIPRRWGEREVTE
jgi:hypothetical protein